MDIADFLKFKQIYTKLPDNLIEQEFSRSQETCYLDHAGATLYSEQQIQNIFSDLSKNIYANPHAKNLPSKLTEDAIDIIRYQILEHFNTNYEEYSVIFTHSATASLKIIAECFNYGENSQGTFTYLETNHTSVLGMRNYNKNTTEIKIVDAYRYLSTKNNGAYSEDSDCGNSIFVYPAQCNFSGTKFPLEWIANVKKCLLNNLTITKGKHWYVVLDCAGYVSTNSLDLHKYKPDFVPISFYKMFGYPTGIGALLVRKSSEALLQKQYFGGGTLLMALSSKNVMIPRITLHERFEDGTLPFLSILALKHGFDTIKRLNLNFDLISKHTYSLAQYVYRNLLTLHHSNGKPVAVLYHDTIFDSRDHQGGTVNFNLLRPNGEYIGYSEVLQVANLHGIHLRTGCFCNPGACQRYLKLQPDDVFEHFKAGHVCGDQHDLVNDYPTGSVRISFGYMSTLKDAKKFMQMIEEWFVTSTIIRKFPENWSNLQEHHKTLFDNLEITSLNNNYDIANSQQIVPIQSCNNGLTENYQEAAGTLLQILLYPIKSCGAFSVNHTWTITSKGLKFDREWMIINATGICVTQKHNKKLCLIMPSINLETNMMKLEFKDHPSIRIGLDIFKKEQKAYLCQSKICGDNVQGWDCGNDIADWLSNCLETPGLRLLRQYSDKNIEDSTRQLSFANKAQYLLVNSASVKWLMSKIPNGELSEDLDSVTQRFRPNFVVNLTHPFEEDESDKFFCDGITFKYMGKCTRCQMICVNQKLEKRLSNRYLLYRKNLKGRCTLEFISNNQVVMITIVQSLLEAR